MLIRTAYICFLLTLMCCSKALAAANEEVVVAPRLFMLGDIGQSLSATYSYAGHTGSGASTSSSALSESYTASSEAVILNEHLVNMQLQGGVTYQQQFEQKSKVLDWLYDVSASVLDMTPYPSTFSSSRSSTLVSNGFLPSYTLTTTGNRMTASLLNTVVPANFYYAHSVTEVQRSSVASSSTSDSAGLTLNHQYLDISQSRFGVNFSDSSSLDRESRMYSMVLGNQLALDKKHNYQLSTAFEVSQAISNNVPQKNVNLGEDLTCQFGPALSGVLRGAYTSNSTLNLQGETQSQDSKAVSASLSHRLYQSFSTSLSGSYSQSNFLGGTSDGYGGNVALSYSKILPAQSNLVVSAQVSRLITAQNLLGAQLSAQDELHPAVRQGDTVTLALSGKLISVTSVTSRNPSVTYQEGLGKDYQVDLVHGVIVIERQGNIAPGTANDPNAPGIDLFISYTVEVNPSISFQSDSASTSANLSLFGSRYNLNADFTTTSQKLLSGEASNQGLVSSHSLTLRALANYNPTTLGVEYGLTDGTQGRTTRYSGFATNSASFDDGSSYSSNLRDTYTVTSASDGNSGSNQNVASLSASYSRKLFGYVDSSLAGALDDNRSTGTVSDFASLRATFSGVYNQLHMSLVLQTLYRISGAVVDGSNYLQFTISRSF